MLSGASPRCAEELKELGFDVELMEDGSFKVIANTDEAKASLADMIGRLNMLTHEGAAGCCARQD
ncbi:hypothetical protein GS485_17435 [Rhodococcus hoagii]|nr:hypothetical protein [Prescottella equi]